MFDLLSANTAIIVLSANLTTPVTTGLDKSRLMPISCTKPDILLREKENSLDLKLGSGICRQQKIHSEFQILCKILIMFTYLMTSKLIYLIMDCETLN